LDGARIFNSLPISVRSVRRVSVDDFKAKLDKYLETLADEPILQNYIPAMCNQLTAAPSNSIIDHARTKFRRPG
jgi:hypothetical protein